MLNYIYWFGLNEAKKNYDKKKGVGLSLLGNLYESLKILLKWLT